MFRHTGHQGCAVQVVRGPAVVLVHENQQDDHEAPHLGTPALQAGHLRVGRPGDSKQCQRRKAEADSRGRGRQQRQTAEADNRGGQQRWTAEADSRGRLQRQTAEADSRGGLRIAASEAKSGGQKPAPPPEIEGKLGCSRPRLPAAVVSLRCLLLLPCLLYTSDAADE